MSSQNKTKQQFPLPGEKPIAEERVLDLETKQHKIARLYQSQLDALAEMVCKHPNIIELMAEDFGFYERDPNAWRERMLEHGIPYDRQLWELAQEIGIGKSYTVFGNSIRDYIWEKMRHDHD